MLKLIQMFDIFRKKKPDASENEQGQLTPPTSVPVGASEISSAINPVQVQSIATSSGQDQLAILALNHINDGVVVVDPSNQIRFINPAATTMANYGTPNLATGLDYQLVLKIETKEGRELTDAENPLIRAINGGQTLESYSCLLVSNNSNKRIPISLAVLPAENGNKIITFRNIEKELAEENEQTEFISTASHEMRTPVATIDGYITLCLNPQTATIDERARGYLDSAAKASKHLGKLFQDLLDATKLDDGRIRPTFVPIEMTSFVKQITGDHMIKARDAGLNLTFGANTPVAPDDHRLEQMLYGSADADFLREIMDNLIDNAIKYTPKGGSIFVNVVGDDEYVIINVSDNGIGISAEDLSHVFQKFYRADNSDTREIGGTGLGLYLVKQRAEAMGGRVWAESTVGQGTTFYVALPRISSGEYQKRMIAVQNVNMVNNMKGEIK